MDTMVQFSLWRQLIILVPLGIILTTAAVTDWRERKVYNWLSYPSVGIGLVAHAVAFGWEGMLYAFLSVILTFVVGFILFVFLPKGWLSAGDIKLMCGVAAFLGGAGLLQMLFYSVLVGGVLGLGMAMINGYLWVMIKKFANFFRGLFRMAVYRTTAVGEKLEQDERSRVPFAVAMFFGMILAYCDRRWHTPNLLDIYINALSV